MVNILSITLITGCYFLKNYLRRGLNNASLAPSTVTTRKNWQQYLFTNYKMLATAFKFSNYKLRGKNTHLFKPLQLLFKIICENC